MNHSENPFEPFEWRGPVRPARKHGGNGDRSYSHELETGSGTLHVNVVCDRHGPYRVFSLLSPIGSELSSVTSALGIMVSKFLEIGGSPATVIKHLSNIKSDRPFGFGPKRVDSIAQAISVALAATLGPDDESARRPRSEAKGATLEASDRREPDEGSGCQPSRPIGQETS